MRKDYQRVASVEVFTDENYSLEIQKTDESGKLLSGAEFILVGGNGEYPIEESRPSSGSFVFEGLEPEVTYTLTETKAPEGYQKKEESYTIVMDANGKLTVKEGTKTLVAGQDYTWDENNLVLSFSVKNEKLKKEIVLTKFDKDTMDPLEGAVFIIQPYNMFAANPYTWASNYNVTGEINKEFVTDSKGQIVINEETYPGVIDQLIKDYKTAIKIDGKDIFIQGYRFREIKAPEGYPDPGFNKDVLLEEKDAGKDFSAEINMDDLKNDTKTDFAYSVTNTKKVILGNAELVKFDIEDRKQKLSGAKFDLYAEGNNTPIQTDLMTDGEGKISVSNLPIGEYYFVETQAPNGYDLPEGDANRFEFSITVENASANIVVGVEVFNIKENVPTGFVKLYKHDSKDQKNGLKGAEFELYRADGTRLESNIQTDKDGIIERELPLGEYYFIETKAPDGYAIPESPNNRFDFSITEADTTSEKKVEVDVENVKIPVGSVRLYKHDSKDEKNGLQGAEFSLFKKDGTRIETGLKTENDGFLKVSGLPVGEYYFEETKAPNGYMILSSGPYEFEITEASIEQEQVIELEVANHKTPPRELILTKVDEQTEKPIPGVEFVIQYSQVSNPNFSWIVLRPENKPLDLPFYFYTDSNGQIIINDTTYPGLIDYLIRMNENPTTSGLRFREISSPAGYEDPFPTDSFGSDSRANELLSLPYAIPIPMDELIGQPLFDESIKVELRMTNKKEQNEQTIIRVEKHDKTTGSLITDGEATFIIQSLREDNQWSAFNEQQFTTQNGVAVIEDEELINDLLYFQGGKNDQKYRFREIKAPVGYKDPQAPNPLSANEAPGGIGDEFSKEFLLDKENPETVTVEIENEKPDDPADRTVTLKKEDDSTDEALKGAAFEVEKYDAGSDTWKPTSIGKKTTGNNGLIELSEQEINSLGSDYPIYIAFKEVTPPDGYEMPKNPYSDTITITADGVTPERVVKENSRLDVDLEFVLRKVDGFSNMPLAGAGFQLYKEDQYGNFKLNGPGYYYTEDDGQYIFSDFELSRLEPGNYKLKEVEAPDGYELPDDPFTEVFTVSSTGVTPDRLVKKNYKSSEAELKKVDQNGKPVKGAKFDLYKYPGPGATGIPEDYGFPTYETDENGQIIIEESVVEEMEDGVYFWRERAAPEGYEILEQDTRTFTIQNGKANPPVISHVNQYDGRLLKFTKVDDRLGQNGHNESWTGLTGAVFELEKQDGSNWETIKDKDGKTISFTTESIYDDDGDLDQAGVITLNDQDIEKYGLSNGKYRFREITPPPGYELPEDPYTPTFEIKDTVIAPEEIVKTNSRLSDRDLTLKKVDGRDQSLGLAGAKFEFEWTWGERAGETDHYWNTYKEWNPETKKNEPVIFETDSNGDFTLTESQIFSIYGIGDGDHRKGRFKEVEAPEGYLMPEDVYTEIFEIRATDIVDMNGRPITEIKKVNYKPVNNYEMELLKVNDNEVRLDGAEFTLVPTDGSGQPQVSTGDKGVFTFKDLEPDVEYTLTETKAPDDYFINKTPYTFILRTDEDPDGILEVYYNGKLLEEGKDYEWNSTQLKLSLVMINRKSSMPITGSIGILSLLIAGATAIGVAYNFQLKKKKIM